MAAPVAHRPTTAYLTLFEEQAGDTYMRVTDGIMTDEFRGLRLLDEPSEGLAPVVVQAIGRLLDELCDTGPTMVLAEQNHRFTLRHADRAYLIEKGAIQHEAAAAELDGSDALQR